VLAALRQQANGHLIPVIVVSGDASVSHRVDLLSSGASDFLVKPVDLQEFVARVRLLLQSHSPAFGAELSAAADRSSHLAVRQILDREAFHPVYQPIVELQDRRLVALEALTRFDSGLRPDLQFAEASRVGLGIELEVATLRAAIERAGPLSPEVALSLNVSVAMLLHGALPEVLVAVGDRSLLLELTEQERVEEYPAVGRALSRLGPNVSLTIDDTGSGYASLSHVLALKPRFVKVDRTWVHNIDQDPTRQALLSGVRRFVDQLGGTVIVEGIETPGELRTVVELGVTLGQGWLLGRPARSHEGPEAVRTRGMLTLLPGERDDALPQSDRDSLKL
jgi:EAL domain-containing protein (putative c-di-GMP-specific phosphodiesterase class I)